ncbi:DUF1028 domain-containing protein [Amycolatopsis rubida]|uniref:DUF1028 domain-containing protein n=1 Tax=Amycolatopsis rubida TaxID=112413 RepID=A0ABX0BL31_9PSEU|nr:MULTISPECIES: DUF1028 domain-containing protein [Amycolatopsis]MYW90678.1 DUF1028 domain-containing protein [Amycolatopsis rubida]NEC55659.1 DUF1028 domain-containing protein [Amycolatopsis rubida]OAP23730.1 hypothetical protein A4R44_05591 [Amycolatopsis sp. M39]
MTYSIVARDESTGQLGVACQSHFFAPGASVTWAAPGVGAIATQAFVDGRYGAHGLNLLDGGVPAAAALDQLLRGDDHPDVRQVALVGAEGDAAAWTGQACIASAGHLIDGPVSVQGNMLDHDGVLPAMLAAWHRGEGDLAERLVRALEAAEHAGGDIRGSQGAALLVVDGARTARPWQHKPIDLRVEDHPAPVAELRRLLACRRAFDAVSGTMFAPGLMVGPYNEPEPGDRDRALAALAGAARVLDGNPEAEFWRGVLLARSGDLASARGQLAGPLAANPRLDRFLDRLADAGFLDHDDRKDLR